MHEQLTRPPTTNIISTKFLQPQKIHWKPLPSTTHSNPPSALLRISVSTLETHAPRALLLLLAERHVPGFLLHHLRPRWAVRDGLGCLRWHRAAWFPVGGGGFFLERGVENEGVLLREVGRLREGPRAQYSVSQNRLKSQLRHLETELHRLRWLQQGSTVLESVALLHLVRVSVRVSSGLLGHWALGRLLYGRLFHFGNHWAKRKYLPQAFIFKSIWRALWHEFSDTSSLRWGTSPLLLL